MNSFAPISGETARARAYRDVVAGLSERGAVVCPANDREAIIASARHGLGEL